MSQLASGGKESLSLNKYMGKVIETCNQQMEEDIDGATSLVSSKYRKPLQQVLICKELYKFMAENNFDVKLPYTGSPVERL